MSTDIEYIELPNGHGFCAQKNGKQIGKINIVIIGANRLIIESTYIDDEYVDTDLCKNLVGRVVELARSCGRKILCMCPRAQSVLNRFSEFDDVRLIKLVAQ